MKSLTIDFTEKYENDGFSGIGFGNIFCIISYLLSKIDNKRTKIKLIANKNSKTYNDALLLINYINFNDFKIILNDQNNNNNLIEINNLKFLNDKLNIDYLIKHRKVENDVGYFHAFSFKDSKKLNITFKKELFKIYKPYIAINVRRGEKINYNNYLIPNKEIYKKIIQDNIDKNILFISDDIEWCKENFSHFKNTSFLNSSRRIKANYRFLCYIKSKILIWKYGLFFYKCLFINVRQKYRKNIFFNR